MSANRRSVFQRIFDPEIHLRQRLFQLLSTIALAEFILVTAYTILFGGRLDHIVVMLAGTMLFAITVSLTFKTGKMRIGSTVSSLLYFSIYPLTFFSSGGMYGGAPVVFAFALVYVFLVTQNWERVACLALCIAASAACYAVAYLNPELLARHTMLMEEAESLLSILLVVLLLCSLFAFVTEVYAGENRIVQKQKREIEELNGAQKRFFSNMSHEIRTPVNAIIGFNEATLREDISGEVRENAQNIEVASKILLHTVNEILDMSKLETGGLTLVVGDYRTTAMLSEITGMMSLQARSKGLAFAVRADKELPSVLRGDEVRIKQILLNVLSNAVKYTREGSVVLSVTGAPDARGGYRVVYEVADTGIGIREESIPQLFTAFQRMDERENHAIEGTGLGLSIVKQLLELMDGSIAVTSEYGKGSVFRIELPQELVDASPVGELNLSRPESANAQMADREESSSIAGLRVLAVDDTPMNLKVVRKLLGGSVLELDTAASGSEALELTRETRYDVILMDHQMPEMDGIECLHAVRAQADGACRTSKIVCMTANAGAEMEQIYRQEGFDGYLAKPVRGASLKGELARLVGMQAKEGCGA